MKTKQSSADLFHGTARPSWPPHSGRARRSMAAFSLVEVTIALGITAFALVSCLGLFSIGLTTFHHAIDMGAQTQITQHLMGAIRQTDFSRLSEFDKEVRYYDDQGGEVREAKEISAQNYIYSVNLEVVLSCAVPSEMVSGESDKLAMVAMTISNRTLPKSAFRFSTTVADNGL